MAIYCVSYDLNQAGQNYSGLYEELKKSPNWWHYLDSTWLIYTNETAFQLFGRLQSKIDNNDRVLIIRVTPDYSGWLTQEAWDWIRSNLG